MDVNTEVLAKNLLIFIDQDSGRLTTTSRRVAEVFGKKPYHVLEKIRALLVDASIEFTASNFPLGSYVDQNGQRRAEYT
jgi:Rha family phage regulatory protein